MMCTVRRLWRPADTFVAEHLDDFRNADFDDDRGTDLPLLPSLHPKNVVFFEAYFQRFDAVLLKVPPTVPQTFY